MKKLMLLVGVVALSLLVLAAMVTAQESGDTSISPGTGSDARVQIDKRFKSVIKSQGRSKVEDRLRQLPSECAQVESAYFAVAFDEECTPKVEATLDSLEGSR